MSGWQFPQWSYGYTQMPGYNYPYPGPGYHPPPPPRPPAPAKGGKAPTSAPVIKAGPVIKQDQPVAGPSNPVRKEDGEIVEKSLFGILNGRNPVMFCNDQSKLRGLHMEWEQVSQARLFCLFLVAYMQLQHSDWLMVDQ